MGKKYLKFLQRFFQLFFLPLWHLQKLIPRDRNLWLFGDRYGTKYSENSRSFFEYCHAEHPEIKAVWITRSKDVFSYLRNRKMNVLYKWSFKSVIYSLRAGVTFYSISRSDINNYFVNGAKLVNLWHGAPIKKFGLLKRKELLLYPCNSVFLYKIKIFFFPYYDAYSFDYVLYTSPYFTNVLKSAFNINEDKLLLTGFPRNDSLFTNSEDDLIKKINDKYNTPYKILYLPTWRSTVEDFDPFIDNEFKVKQWHEFLHNSNSVLIYKPHPGIRVLSKDADSNEHERIVRIEESPFIDINRIMKSVDVLITDYSSVYYDFILLNKPVVLFPYDYSKYISDYYGFSLDYYKEIAGVKCHSWVEILDVIRGKKFQNIDKETVGKFNYYQDGKSSERLYSTISTKL